MLDAHKDKGLVFNIQRFSLHDGPGIRTTVFFKGCPLKCQWCHNPEGINPFREILYKEFDCILCESCKESCPLDAISVENEKIKIDREICNLCGECIKNCQTNSLELCGTYMTTQEILDEVMSDYEFYKTSHGGVTFSGGEPLMQFNFLQKVLVEANKLNLHIALDTSGYIPTENFTKVLDLIDLVLFDVKTLDQARHEKLTGVSNELILKNLKECLNYSIETIIRVPIVYGYNFLNIEEELTHHLLYLHNLGFSQFELIPYHRFGEQKYQMLEKPYDIHMDSNQFNLIEQTVKRIKSENNIEIKIITPILT